jgi:hypothetical protein
VIVKWPGNRARSLRKPILVIMSDSPISLKDFTIKGVLTQRARRGCAPLCAGTYNYFSKIFINFSKIYHFL